jgi:hypothetical protein
MTRFSPLTLKIQKKISALRYSYVYFGTYIDIYICHAKISNALKKKTRDKKNTIVKI